MTDESGPVEREVARFYTRSRKFPRMVGRLPEGTRIWGGPYTFTQLGLGLVAIFVALATRGVWSWGSVLIDLVVVMGVGWGVAYVGRFIPMTNLNPLVVVSTALGAFSAPVAGTYRGRSVVVTRPHVVHGRAVIESAPDDGAGRLDARPARGDAAPVPDAAPARPRDVPRGPERAPTTAARGRTTSRPAGPSPAPDAVRPHTVDRGRAVTGLDRLLAQAGTTRTPNGR